MNKSLIGFSKLVDELFDYMQRKIKPSNEIRELWYQKLNKISGTEMREAFEYMQDNFDSLPFNLPKAIKKAVFEINRAKPQQKSEIKSYGDCEDCNGTGIFKTRIFLDGIWYEPIQYCSECENWRKWTGSPGKRISRAELEARGIMWKPYNRAWKYQKLEHTHAKRGAA